MLPNPYLFFRGRDGDGRVGGAARDDPPSRFGDEPLKLQVVFPKKRVKTAPKRDCGSKRVKRVTKMGVAVRGIE